MRRTLARSRGNGFLFCKRCHNFFLLVSEQSRYRSDLRKRFTNKNLLTKLEFTAPWMHSRCFIYSLVSASSSQLGSYQVSLPSSRSCDQYLLQTFWVQCGCSYQDARISWEIRMIHSMVQMQYDFLLMHVLWGYLRYQTLFERRASSSRCSLYQSDLFSLLHQWVSPALFTDAVVGWQMFLFEKQALNQP